ncbi:MULTISPECIES: S-methyl-5-thioribose kinase [Vagococcus]|uniref:S-methyl-5-thioribose kinase n=1 Tax=Vagococcus fluvialis bH819 TaxID=1255619 RepID=A0A1X6WPS3_9ENTE|nr:MULTISPECIES: S-methyl-5-thioribose kinase [Vagococcus]SLM86285.1 5-methylthioribose kinase [Vagococcus fluvialis bH819]HCM88889.1 S-methyl-5-thioribose kinase [Vagococcus sp.]
MEKFKAHFLMSHDDVKEYVTQKLNLFSKEAELVVKEVGDGNINYVFIVEDAKTKKSVVVKQADVLLRSSGRPLDINRNKIEADILKIQYDLVPEFIPEIYHYDEAMAALTMEDISAYKNLRYELEKKIIFPKLADEISTFLVETLLSTTDLVWDRQDKKKQVKNFVNIDMCDISEDLVFTEPYNDYKKQNVIIEGNQEFVERFIYMNQALLTEIAKLRNNYMNNAQALVHGDLHSGSIFVNQDGMKVIDPEFAFYGPMGYDIGNVIGNLFFPLAKNEFYDHDEEFSEWLITTIQDIFDQVKEKLTQAYAEKVSLSIYQNEAFKTQFINGIMADTLGYVGTEIIRRVIGDSKVKEVATAPLGKERIAMERSLLKLGIDLILHRDDFNSGEELVKAFQLVKA